MERTAKCGRSDEHGAHAYLETNGPRNGHRRWCAGSNRPMDRLMTYQQMLRNYANGVGDGLYDDDLTPRQRRFVRVIVNTAANAPLTAVIYPPTDRTRDDAVRLLVDRLWDGNASALLGAAGQGALDDFTAAQERAVEIIRGV